MVTFALNYGLDLYGRSFEDQRAKRARASYNLGATGRDLLFGSFHTTSGLWKDKLAKLFVSLFAQEAHVNPVVRSGQPVEFRMLY